jgi:hypothetical protein
MVQIGERLGILEDEISKGGAVDFAARRDY